MSRMGTWLRTAACAVAIPLALVAHSLVAIALALWGAGSRPVSRVYQSFARTALRIAGTRFEVHGRENLEPGVSYVLVSNHESNLDPMLILAALPELSIRFVIKRQILDIPVLGAALRRTDNVEVDRANTSGDVKRIQAGMAARAPDVSVLFFAEGTRSRDGSLQPFKKGAFVTALEEDLPVLPLAVAGTRPLWTPETPRMRSGLAVVEIGKPLATEGLPIAARDDLRERAQRTVGELRARARARLRDRGVDPGGVD